MLKRLPIILLSAALFVIFFSSKVYAQNAPTATPAQSPVQMGVATVTPQPGDWVSDPTVTFVGKTASRSNDFLDLTLRTYDWACVKKDAQNVCDNTNNPLVPFWATIRNIIYAMLIAVVLVSAFVMIITRGKSLTITRFIPRFVLIMVLVTLSYALIQFIYQITDIIQGFFLKTNGNLITTRDLIYIGFPYDTFTGLRRFGEAYDESAFITLLLVRLTAMTYYVMSGILIVRKIILWFFIILSPVFPLLLFIGPIRNTGKIWIGEFLRWLLYAPLFAIFLNGLVIVWKSGIPLAFDFTKANAGEVIYPTAVNILIGGPGQTIGLTNSVNLQDTFALYVASLLMLWVVIILPFILLKFVISAIGGVSVQNNLSLKRLFDRGVSRSSTPSVPVADSSPRPSGHTPQSSFGALQTHTTPNTLNTRLTKHITSIPVNSQILQKANLSVPKMRDIAKFDTSMVSKNSYKMQDVSRLKTSLNKISNPEIVSSPVERGKYAEVRQQLIAEKQKGNILASSILSAADTSTSKEDTKTQASSLNLPSVNKVQEVKIEDYEEVKKEWTDAYRNAQPPIDVSGKEKTREEWLKSDIDKINQAIALLNSVDPARANDGMNMVADILPFLMIGGFSKTEVIAYLKAKLEAAKSVLSGASNKEEKNSSFLGDIKADEAGIGLPTEDLGKAKIEDIRNSGEI